jgi:hypothetical protein
VHPVTLTVHPPGYRATDQTGATKDQTARHGARAGSGMRRAAGNGPLAHVRPQERGVGKERVTKCR